jgi:hypothetical protein
LGLALLDAECFRGNDGKPFEQDGRAGKNAGGSAASTARNERMPFSISISRKQRPPQTPQAILNSNHGPVVAAPVTPHVAAFVPVVESAMQTADAVTVTAIAAAGHTTTEAATKMAAAEPAAASECAG